MRFINSKSLYTCIYLCTYVGCYYFTLGNINPIYRLSLNPIQLLSLVEAPVLEQYGHDKILQLAITDIKKLEQVCMCKYVCTLVHKLQRFFYKV